MLFERYLRLAPDGDDDDESWCRPTSDKLAARCLRGGG